ncbi:hypothetical protein GA0115246_115592 [Streptomyces sp. SolWspMP-sol7th]|nr:hypothetical protein GA0115246_115592 [Streptomyces sp. SolWspMP-sol7th]
MAGPPAGGQRGAMAAAHGCTMAGSACTVRALADSLRTLRPLGGGRHLGEAPGARPGPQRFGRRGRMDRLGGLDDQPCTSARRRRPRKREAGGDEPADSERAATRQALGRSRGGLTTKVRLIVDGRGLPLALVLTPGNINDSTVFVPGDGRDPHPTRRAGPSPYSSGQGPGRQGVLIPGYSRVVQTPRHRRHHPGTSRPAGQIGSAGAHREAVRPSSTHRRTDAATSWKDASTGSNSSAPSQPASANSPPAARPDSNSPRSSCGSANQHRDHCQTRPRAANGTEESRVSQRPFPPVSLHTAQHRIACAGPCAGRPCPSCSATCERLLRPRSRNPSHNLTGSPSFTPSAGFFWCVK